MVYISRECHSSLEDSPKAELWAQTGSLNIWFPFLGSNYVQFSLLAVFRLLQMQMQIKQPMKITRARLMSVGNK